MLPTAVSVLLPPWAKSAICFRHNPRCSVWFTVRVESCHAIIGEETQAMRESYALSLRCAEVNCVIVIKVVQYSTFIGCRAACLMVLNSSSVSFASLGDMHLCWGDRGRLPDIEIYVFICAIYCMWAAHSQTSWEESWDQGCPGPSALVLLPMLVEP